MHIEINLFIYYYIMANINNELSKNIEEPDELKDLFKNDVITVNELEVIPEYERIYKDDNIYRDDYKNYFLQELPITLQNDKYIQEKISLQVANMIDSIHIARSINKMGNDYPLKFSYKNQTFSSKFIIPVILDKQVIYSNISAIDEELQEELTRNEPTAAESTNQKKSAKSKNSISEEPEKEDIQSENLLTQLRKINELNIQYEKNEIDYEQYQIKYHNIVMPFIIQKNLKDKPVGYKMNLKDNTEILRFFNINTSHWKKRVGTSPVSVPYDILDENKRIKATGRHIIINGEEINIVGFLIISTEKITNNLVGDITHIDISPEKTIITLPNHGLLNGDAILIRENSQLNGIYYNIERIDENKISLPLDSSKITILTGKIYSAAKLNFITKKVFKNNTDFFIRNDKDVNVKTNNVLYLFDDLLISKDEFPKLIDALFPTIDDILAIESNNITNKKFVNEINSILSKYELTINDLSIEQFNIIKQTLKTITDNEVKSMKSYIPVEINHIDDYSSTIYNDKNIFDKRITDRYGIYPLKDHIFDNVRKRISWINSQIDFGSYFYNTIIIDDKSIDKTTIESLIKNVKNYNSSIKSTYDKERKTNTFFDKCVKYVAEYTNKQQMLKDKTVYNNGDIAIIIDDKKLFKWNKNTWEFYKDIEDAYNLPCVCKFNGIDVDDLKDLPCDFTQYGCKSLKTARNEIRLKLSEDILNNLIQYANNLKTDKEQIEEKNILISQYWKTFLTTEKKVVEKIAETEPLPSELNDIMKGLSKIHDTNLHKYLVYKIIELDGILIGNKIYSKRFNLPLFCGHYMFLKRIDYTYNNSVKNSLVEQMNIIYGDEAQTEHGYYTCKSCGARLGRVAFDEAAGFDDSGNPIRITEKWIDEKGEIKLKMQKEKSGEFTCHSLEFENELRIIGFTQEQVGIAIEYCDIITSLAKQLSIKIDKLDYISILSDILSESIPSLNDCKKFYFAKFKSSGKSINVIKKLDEQGEFTVLCQKLIQIKKMSIISARFIILLQTSVPAFKIGRIKTNCAFTEDLSNLLGCLIEERKLIAIKRKDGKAIIIKSEEITNEINKYLEKFQRKSKIRKLYDARKIYDAETKLNVREDESQKEIRAIETFKIPEIPKLTGNEWVDFDKLYHRSIFINQYIIDTIKSSVKDSKLLIDNISIVENACCSYPVNNNYLSSIDDQTFRDYLVETIEIAKYYKFIVDKGSISRWECPYSRIYITNNKPTFDVVDETIYTKKFQMYCSTGTTRGELHSFISKSGICVKCGFNINEPKTYTADEYNRLLNDVIKLNTHYYKKTAEIETDFGKKIKKEISDIEKYINKFLEKLSKILGKDIKLKYKDFLYSLGNYTNVYVETNSNSPRQIITLINNREENRIFLLKNYINRYFRTYISMLSNYDDVNKIQEKLPEFMCDYSKDIQKCVIDEYLIIGQFMNPDNMDLFGSLKINYTISEVNNIYGNSDIYNCTWSKVIKESNFTLSDASEVLLYILVSQLDNFIEGSKKNQTVIANFILVMFDMIIEDDTVFNMEEIELNRYKNMIYQTQYSVYSNILSQKTGADLELLKMGLKDDITVDNIIDYDQKQDELKRKYAEIDEDIDALAKEKLGADATLNQIAEFKEEYLRNKKHDDQMIKDQFSFKQAEEGDEILETGDDYSEMPQGHGDEAD